MNFNTNTERNYKLPSTERDKKIKKITKFALGIALATTIIAAGKSFEGGSKSAEAFGEINPQIASITLQQEANLRYDPVVAGGEDNNIIESTEKPIHIETNGDVRVHADEANGDWYGIPVAEVRKADPTFKDHGDKDGVVWVNQQGASVNK